MPREQITPNVSAEEYLVHVGWDRDRDVQIGVEVNGNTYGDATLIRRWFSEPGMVAWLGSTVRITSEAAQATSDELDDDKLNKRDLFAGYLLLAELDKYVSHSSVWATITDRRDVNHLIATLRRARDAAFGKDE